MNVQGVPERRARRPVGRTDEAGAQGQGPRPGRDYQANHGHVDPADRIPRGHGYSRLPDQCRCHQSSTSYFRDASFLIGIRFAFNYENFRGPQLIRACTIFQQRDVLISISGAFSASELHYRRNATYLVDSIDLYNGKEAGFQYDQTVGVDESSKKYHSEGYRSYS